MASQSIHINSLPDEVLLHIFSFLDSRAKLNASSTCKNWMLVMNDRPEMFEDICIFCTEAKSESFYDIFSTMSRNFCYFCFKKFDLNVCQFITKHAPVFRRLNLGSCMFSKYVIPPCKKITNCTNLWELVVDENFATRLFSHLPKLKKLHLYGVMKNFETVWMHLEEMAPLSLTEFKMSCLPFDTPFPLFKDFIWKRRVTLQSLILIGSYFTGEEMLQLSKMKDLRLKRLEVSDIRGFHETISSFCANQQSIIALDLREVRKLDHTFFASLLTTNPQLEELYLASRRLCSESIEMIFQLKCLRRLDISYCRDISLPQVMRAHEVIACCLEYLNLRESEVEHDFLSRLFRLVPNLKELNLYFCSGVIDLTVIAISENLTSLRLLDLSHCNITDDGLMGIVKGSNSPPVPLSNIKALEVLKLNGCDLLTDTGVARAIQFPSLRVLELFHCRKLTKDLAVKLKRFNPKLVKLEFEGIEDINYLEKRRAMSPCDERLKRIMLNMNDIKSR